MKIDPVKPDNNLQNISDPKRQDRIEELKKQIKEGLYKVDSAVLAKKILDSGVLDD